MFPGMTRTQMARMAKILNFQIGLIRALLDDPPWGLDSSWVPWFRLKRVAMLCCNDPMTVKKVTKIKFLKSK